MKMRMTALTLALLLLLPTVLACGKTEETVTTTATTVTSAEGTVLGSADGSTHEEWHLRDEELQKKWEQYADSTVHIISRGRDWCKDEISVEEQIGDVVGDSVYQRNAATEERLGITIENHLNEDPDQFAITEIIRKQVQAGTQEYDLIANSAYGTIIYTADNLFQDMSQLTHLDLLQPYWSQGFNETASVGGKQYLATGSACLSMYRFIFATFFNKKLFDENQIPYLYDAVETGKWTLTYQRELSQNIYSDLNGNSKKDAADLYGFVSNHNMIGVDPYWSACELPILNKNENNYFAYAVDVEKLSVAVDRINELFWANDGAYRVANKTNDTEQDDITAMFAQDRAAMVTLRLIHVESAEMRNMTSLYGIVPIPKLDETQTEYHSYAHDQITALAIPLTVTGEELELIGLFLDVFARESHRAVMPAYYETALKVKYVSDEQSVVMLDRIVNSLRIDAGMLYSRLIGLPHKNMRTWIGGNSNTVSSQMKSTQRVTEKMVDKMNEELAALP